MPRKQFDLIVFDWDGTLMDSTAAIVRCIQSAARDLGLPAVGGSLGSMWGIFFADRPVTDFAGAQRSDVELFRRFFRGCLDRGVFFAPSAFEAGFTSTAHTNADIEETIHRAGEALRAAIA